MRRNSLSKILPLAVPVLGLGAAVLRWVLYALGPDEKNLLPLWHPAAMLQWGLTVLGAVLILLGRWEEDCRTARGPWAALGCLVMALGLGASGFGGLDRILSIAGALCLVGLGWQRFRGEAGRGGLCGLLCLFFAFHLVTRYRAWSGDPQMEDFVIPMLGLLSMMLFSYQQAALEAGFGKVRYLNTAGLLGCLMCLASLGHTENPLLFAAGAVWTVTNLATARKEIRAEEETDHDPA